MATVLLFVLSGPGCGDDTAADSSTTTQADAGSGSSTGTASSTSTTMDASDATTFTESSSSTEVSSTNSSTDSSGSTGSSSTSEPTTGSSSGTATEPTDSTTTGGNVECPAGELAGALPLVIEDSTLTQDDAFSSSCGPQGGADKAFTFTAPQAGTYTFHTGGSTLNTVLYVLDGVCEGSELGCNVAGLGSGGSVVAVDLASGQTVTVVVDSFGVNGGDFRLGVVQYECPASSVPSPLPQTLTGSTANGLGALYGGCGLNGPAPEATYSFTVPQTGICTFDTHGSAFDATLYLLEGTDCSAPVLECNSDGGEGVQAFIQRSLVAGQQLVVVVDGYGDEEGAYQLNIDELDVVCPNEDLASVSPLTTSGTTVGAQNTLDPSCGVSNAPEYAMTWTAKAAGTYTFDTNGSGFNTILSVLGGTSCGGPVLACDDDSGVGSFSELSVTLSAGQDVVIVVDGANANAGAFTLHITG